MASIGMQIEDPATAHLDAQVDILCAVDAPKTEQITWPSACQTDRAVDAPKGTCYAFAGHLGHLLALFARLDADNEQLE